MVKYDNKIRKESIARFEKYLKSLEIIVYRASIKSSKSLDYKMNSKMRRED